MMGKGSILHDHAGIPAAKTIQSCGCMDARRLPAMLCMPRCPIALLALAAYTSFAGGPDGSVWIGTLAGLVLWRDRVVRVWTERDGLADNVVWSILPARDGSLRVGTAHERLRTAIAADLHDHIGAGLTEIAILSEIVAHRTGGSAPELGKVADTARQLLDKMNEIVWLVNPRRDSLHDLFVRLKDSYSELFSHAGVLFRATDLALFERVRLPMSYRENLYLIFKEALNNSLRHSGCQEIELAVALQGKRFEVVLRDDGRGFDPGGNGRGTASAT